MLCKAFSKLLIVCGKFQILDFPLFSPSDSSSADVLTVIPGAVSMSSISVLFIFAVIGLHVGYARCEFSQKSDPLVPGSPPPLKNTFSFFSPAFINVNCIPEIKGRYGQASVLECKVSTSEEVTNPKITWLSWTKDGKNPLVLYKNSEVHSWDGYSFAHQSWQTSLDVSLRIANTSVQHEGVYMCQMAMTSGKATGQSKLSVTGESRILMAAEIQWWSKQGTAVWN